MTHCRNMNEQVKEFCQDVVQVIMWSIAARIGAQEDFKSTRDETELPLSLTKVVDLGKGIRASGLLQKAPGRVIG